MIAVTAVTAGVPATAHHSFAMFDAAKTVRLSGVVHEFQWTNPHVFIELTVPDANGKPVNWSIEGGAPSALSRLGWKRNSLAVGDKVTVEINPLRSGASGGALLSAKLPDGTILKK
jgi:hypothetical protein